MIITQEIPYRDHNTQCIGYLAYDDQFAKPMPGVLIAHDWGGRGESVCDKARQLASLGYVGFALDMYGEATLGQSVEHRQSLIAPLIQHRDQLASRMLAGYRAALDLPQIDSRKVAAIGYCFGGLCVLDLARSGAAINGVISFHGLLHKPQEVSSAPIQAKVLVLHGYDDPLVPPEQVLEFTTEMTLKQVDWQLHMYGLTAHSFTNPEAHGETMGLRYNPTADARSWKTAQNFLQEVF